METGRPFIRVRVIRRHTRKQYALRWEGGEQIAKATWGDEQAAGREAEELERQLNNPAALVLNWQDACHAYEEWHLSMYGGSHSKNWGKTRRRFEKFCGGDVPPIDRVWPVIGQFAANLTGEVSLTTIKGYCQYLRSFLRWCYDQGWLEQPPRKLSLPRQRGRKAKGRPLTAEEFDRMLEAIPLVIRDERNVPSWRFLVRCLWASSLRLGEAANLHYTNGPLRLDLSGEFPLMQFEVESDKGRRERAMPVTREFAELLCLDDPDIHRNGFVFRPRLSRGVTRCLDVWSHRIGEFGRRAGIVVDRNDSTGRVKFASAHDLRRTCLERMKLKLDRVAFRYFARHDDDRTTDTYYVTEQAQQIAKILWDVR